MPVTHRLSVTDRRIASAATLVGVAAMLTALSPGVASAGLHGIELCSIDTGNCVEPTSFVVGQSYSVVGPDNGTPNTNYNFYDNGACIGSGSHGVTWVPLAMGSHTVSATYTNGGSVDYVTVTVVAAPTGTTPQQPPRQGGCGGGGSLGNPSSFIGPGSANIVPGVLGEIIQDTGS
ncbi:hypothetical protein ACFXHA_29450 [Nocardia sp. NPDC059240]|uniref:hypothetical protein n=1 Tax=Nocardia sp. NPDC059240 TaxID=3346786 RepID=UPI0036CDE8BC